MFDTMCDNTLWLLLLYVHLCIYAPNKSMSLSHMSLKDYKILAIDDSDRISSHAPVCERLRL